MNSFNQKKKYFGWVSWGQKIFSGVFWCKRLSKCLFWLYWTEHKGPPCHFGVKNRTLEISMLWVFWQKYAFWKQKIMVFLRIFKFLAQNSAIKKSDDWPRWVKMAVLWQFWPFSTKKSSKIFFAPPQESQPKVLFLLGEMVHLSDFPYN